MSSGFGHAEGSISQIPPPDRSARACRRAAASARRSVRAGAAGARRFDRAAVSPAHRARSRHHSPARQAQAPGPRLVLPHCPSVSSSGRVPPTAAAIAPLLRGATFEPSSQPLPHPFRTSTVGTRSTANGMKPAENRVFSRNAADYITRDFGQSTRFPYRFARGQKRFHASHRVYAWSRSRRRPQCVRPPLSRLRGSRQKSQTLLRLSAHSSEESATRTQRRDHAAAASSPSLPKSASTNSSAWNSRRSSARSPRPM